MPKRSAILNVHLIVDSCFASTCFGSSSIFMVFDFLGLRIINFRSFCGYVLVLMSITYAEKIGHFECSLNCWQLFCLHVFDFYLKRPMKGRRYATLMASKEELNIVQKNDFLNWFEYWKNRWHKCIISHWDYFKGDKIDIHEKINNFWKNIKVAIFFEHTSYVMAKNLNVLVWVLLVENLYR